MTYLIRQMGHVVVSTPDPVAAAQDLAEVVGLRITEQDRAMPFISPATSVTTEVTYVRGEGEHRRHRP